MSTEVQSQPTQHQLHISVEMEERLKVQGEPASAETERSRSRTDGFSVLL